MKVNLKLLLMFLVFSVSGSIFAADESKGVVLELHPNSEGVIEKVEVPLSAFEKFGPISLTLNDEDKDGDRLDFNVLLVPFRAKYKENFNNLIRYLSSKDLATDIEVVNLIEMVNLASELGASEVDINKIIKLLISKELSLLDYKKLNLANLERIKRYTESPLLLTLENVMSIEWSPRGDRCLVEYRNRRSQLYNIEGEALGGALESIDSIDWSSRGDRYFVVHRDGSRQLYSAEGEALGDRLKEVRLIRWSPRGDRYFVVYRDSRGQLYNNEGTKLGSRLEDVSSVKWSPRGDRYFVVYLDGRGQLYNAEGVALGNILVTGHAEWNPRGDRCFVRYSINRWQMYSSEGVALGGILDGVVSVKWSPSGDRCLVLYRDGSGQLFNSNGELVSSDKYKNVFWSPKGDLAWYLNLDNKAELYLNIDFNKLKSKFSLWVVYKFINNNQSKVILSGDELAEYNKLSEDEKKVLQMLVRLPEEEPVLAGGELSGSGAGAGEESDDDASAPGAGAGSGANTSTYVAGGASASGVVRDDPSGRRGVVDKPGAKRRRLS